jgi:hypothetical protein
MLELKLYKDLKPDQQFQAAKVLSSDKGDIGNALDYLGNRGIVAVTGTVKARGVVAVYG